MHGGIHGVTLYRFGDCVLDVERRALSVAGETRRVEPQVFDLLVVLATNGDAVTSREQLLEKVWKGRMVSDSAISVRINKARQAVNDSGSAQAVIRTVPRRGFRLVPEVFRTEAGGGTSESPSRGKPEPVLAIFPFLALSEDLPDYLVRGIAEDLATELSRFRDIQVLSPYSTFRHDFELLDRSEIARSLGVTHFVTGDLRGESAINQARVSLVEAKSGRTIWSERYEIDGEDIFAAQDDAVNQIVSALVHGLANHQVVEALRKPASSLSAYECVLRGLQIYKWGGNSLDEARQALFWFDRAIELDAGYARARAWRECCFSSFWSSPPTEEELKGSANRMALAHSLDENDHEVHRLKGALHMCSGEHALADYHLARSVELNPNDAHILIKIGMYRSFLADPRQDLDLVRTAFSRNPHHPAWYWVDRAIVLFAHARYDELIDSLDRGATDSEVTRLYRAATKANMGDVRGATEDIDRLRAMTPAADIDWLKVAYPTRCYEPSETRDRFFEGLKLAGL